MGLGLGAGQAIIGIIDPHTALSHCPQGLHFGGVTDVDVGLGLCVVVEDGRGEVQANRWGPQVFTSQFELQGTQVG